MKNPLTLAGIEPATFRFVAQHLNHYATAVPRWMNGYGAMVEWYWQGKTEVLGEKHYIVWVVGEWMGMEHCWNDTDKESQGIGRKPCSSATLSTTNLTWTDLGSKPVLHAEGPVTHRPTHGTAFLKAHCEHRLSGLRSPTNCNCMMLFRNINALYF